VTNPDTYQNLRQFADSWGLLAMVIFFVTACAWPYRPGGRKAGQEASTMIFEEDDHVQ
jgi:cytochrome c oxidase cbb3-type subunit 4